MECPGLEECINRRVSDAEQRGVITQKLLNIESAVIRIESGLELFKTETRKSINRLYMKVAGISGGAAVIGFVIAHFTGK